MRHYILSLILVLPLFIFSQEDRIDAQRPTLSESYSIIGSNTIQAETGLNYDFETKEYTSTTFIRHSFFNRVELRVSQVLTNNDFSYGTKLVLFKNSNPSKIGVSFIYTNDVNDDYRVALSRDFNRLSLTFNTGWNDSVIGGRYNILLCSYLLLPDWSVFIEGQSSGTNNTSFERTIQGGVMFIPTDNIQLDTSIGYLEGHGPYVGAGLSFKINYGKKENFKIAEIQ